MESHATGDNRRADAHIKQKNASDEVMPSLGSSSMRFRPIHARMYLHGEAAL